MFYPGEADIEKVNTFFRRIGFCILLLCLTPLWGIAAPEMRVEGTLLSEQGTPVENVTVVLAKIVMQQKPTITPLSQAKTDQAGQFQIPVEPFDGNVFFRVTAGEGGLMIGSEPFRLSAVEPVKRVRLVMMTPLSGLSHLTFRKHLLVFEAQEESLQVTEVIYFSNTADRAIETGDTPFIKKIDENASDIQFFNRQGHIQTNAGGKMVRFDLAVPPGDHQLLFSYNLPARGSTISLPVYTPTGIPELEIVTPVNQLDLSFDTGASPASGRVLSQEKRFADGFYRSLTFYPDGNQPRIEIRVDNIPVSQSRLYYPAMLLAAVLVCGLLFYLARHPRSISQLRNV